MKLLEKTNRHIAILKSHLREIDYQLVFGGAVRDSLMEKDYQDIDLFFTDKTKYINTVGTLCESGYEIVKLCKRKWSENNICLFGRYEKENPWGKNKESIDVMLFDCTEEDLIEDFKKIFDFGVNLCYMKKGKVYADERCLRGLEENTLELVSDKISIGNCIVRANKFQERGFKVGSSIIAYIINEIELMESSPEDYRRSRYMKVTNGYYESFRVDEKKLYGDFFQLLDEDTMILAMMSNSDNILDYAKKTHNKKVNKGILNKLRVLLA